MIVVWDVVRVIAALASLAVTGLTAYVLVRDRGVLPRHQRMRFLGSGLLGPPLVVAYLSQLGTLPDQYGWRTAFITAAMLLFAAGLLGFIGARHPPDPDVDQPGEDGPSGRHAA